MNALSYCDNYFKLLKWVSDTEVKIFIYHTEQVITVPSPPLKSTEMHLWRLVWRHFFARSVSIRNGKKPTDNMDQLTETQKQEALAYIKAHQDDNFDGIATFLSRKFGKSISKKECVSLYMDSLF